MRLSEVFLHELLEALEALQRLGNQRFLGLLPTVQDAQPRQEFMGLVAQQCMYVVAWGIELRVLANLLNGVIVSDSSDLAVLNYNLFNFVGDGQGGEKTGTPWNSTLVYRLVDGKWRVVDVNWSFTRHPAAMQDLMS